MIHWGQVTVFSGSQPTRWCPVILLASCNSLSCGVLSFLLTLSKFGLCEHREWHLVTADVPNKALQLPSSSFNGAISSVKQPPCHRCGLSCPLDFIHLERNQVTCQPQVLMCQPCEKIIFQPHPDLDRILTVISWKTLFKPHRDVSVKWENHRRCGHKKCCSWVLLVIVEC